MRSRVFFIILFLALAANVHAFILAGVLGPAVATTGNPPNAVTDLSVTVGDAKNTLTWTASAVDGTHDGATSYDLLWGTVSGTTGNTITGVTSPYQHSPLTNGTTYYYKLVANNASGSATTAQIGPYTPAVLAPNAPVMTASAGDTKVTYTWSAPAVDATHSAATSYNLRWGTVSGSLGTTVTGVTSPYDLTGRTNGTPVYAKLDALNAGGTTSQASEVSATPVASSSTDWDFSTFDSTAWATSTAGGGTATNSGGYEIVDSQGGTTQAATLYYKNGVNRTSAKTYKMKVALTSTTGVADSIYIFGLAQAAPTVDTVTNFFDNKHQHCEIAFLKGSGSWQAVVGFMGSDGNFYGWKSGSWQALTGSWWTSAYYPVTANTEYTAIITTTSTGVSFALKSSDESSTILSTTEKSWATLKWAQNLGSLPTTMYPFTGDAFTDAYGEQLKINSFSIQ